MVVCEKRENDDNIDALNENPILKHVRGKFSMEMKIIVYSIPQFSLLSVPNVFKTISCACFCAPFFHFIAKKEETGEL